MKEIQRPVGSGKSNIRFDYDAMGHRIAKHVYDDSWSLVKSTYYALDAQGNAMGVYERAVDESTSSVTFALKESYIYGSSRLGVRNTDINLLSTTLPLPASAYTAHEIGKKTYELTNHLGNVLSVVSDKLAPVTETSPLYSNDFSTDLSGFVSNGTSTISLSGGRLKVTGSSYANRVRRNFSTVAGRTYVATVDLDLASSGTLAFLARNTTTGSNIEVVTANINQTYTIQFVAQTSVTELAVQNNYSTGTRDYYLDNLTLLDVTVVGYTADIRQSSDYYPFGASMRERDFTLAGAEKFRFGFQNQEMDDEIKGEGNSVNYTFRMHDPRLGRFFAIDPLTKKYPHYSPYSFSGNKVISFVELEGKEEAPVKIGEGGVVGTSMSTNSGTGQTNFTATYSNGDVRKWILVDKTEGIWKPDISHDLKGPKKLDANKSQQTPPPPPASDATEVKINVPQVPNARPLTMSNNNQPLTLDESTPPEVPGPPPGAYLSGANAFAKSAGTMTMGDNGKLYKSGWNGNQYVKTSTVFKDAKIIRKIGGYVPVIGTIMDGYEIGEGIANDGWKGGVRETAGAVGGSLGATGGAWAGAAIGTAICPGIGTVIGGLIGACLGSWGGESAAEGITTTIIDP